MSMTGESCLDDPMYTYFITYYYHVSGISAADVNVAECT